MKILDFIKKLFSKKDPENTGCPFDQEWEFEVSTENNTKIQKCKVRALDPIGDVIYIVVHLVGLAKK